MSKTEKAAKGLGIKPGAHPTAPGGMSQKALLTELIIKHGYSPEQAATYKPQKKWGTLVEVVCQERLNREAEGKAMPKPEDMSEKKMRKELRKRHGWTDAMLDDLKSEDHTRAHLIQARRDAMLMTHPPVEPEAKPEKVKKVKKEKKVLTDDDLYADDLDAADADLAEVDEEVAAAEPTTEEKGKRAASKAQQAVENIEAILSEPEGTEAEVQHEPAKEYQRKPVASSIAKYPHIHVKGKCFQNREAAPCEVEDAEVEAAKAAIQNVASTDDIGDPLAFYEEMNNEHAVALAEYADANPPLFIPITGVQDFVFDGHMGAGPSGAERWMNCTGSLGLTRKFLETLTRNQQEQFAEAGVAAREGTVAHEAAETKVRLMLGEITPEEAEARLVTLATEHPEDEAYSEEMGEWITQYTDLVSQYVDAGHPVLVEARLESVVPMPTPLPNGEETYTVVGSGDFVALPTETDPSTLTVGDLKYGDALWVEVDENPQVRIYALGALAYIMDEEGNLPDEFTTVDYHIIQPRLGGIKSWTEPIEDLLAWRDEVLSPALSEALRKGAPLTPGDQQCQWCPVRGNCPALSALRIEQAQELFTDMNESDLHGQGLEAEADTLTDQKIGDLLTQVNGLVSLQKALKAEVERRLHRGHKVPGFNLVNYTPPRSWHEDAVEKVLAGKGKTKTLTEDQRKSILKPPSLMTPKQALEVLAAQGIGSPEEVLGKLYDTPEKRPVVGPEGDRRSLWAGKPPEQMFPDLTDEEMKA